MTQYRIDLCTQFVKIGEIIAFDFDAAVSDLEPGWWVLIAPSQGIGDVDPELVDSILLRDADTGAIEYAGVLREGNDDARFVRVVDTNGYSFKWEGTDLYGLTRTRIAFPNPATVEPWTTAYDQNTGPASTVAANYLADNMGSTAIAARQISNVTITNPAIGSTVTWDARLTNLANLIQDVCKAGGVHLDTIFDDTTGLTYTFRNPVDLSASIILSDIGDLESATVTKQAPAGTWVLGAAQGELTDRTFRSSDNGLTGFARVEAVYENTNIVNGTSLQTATDARQTELDDMLRVDAIATPDSPTLPRWRTDYLLGDLLGIQINSERFTAPVTSVRFTVNAERQIVYPVFGNSAGNELTSLIRQVDTLSAKLDGAPLERDASTLSLQFRGRRTSSISVPNITYTAMTYNTEDSDPKSMCDGTTATIPTGGGGWWSLFALFVLDSSALGTTVVQRITSSRYGTVSVNDYAGVGHVVYRLPSIWCEAGDTFSLQLYQSSGVARSCTSGYWQMSRITA